MRGEIVRTFKYGLSVCFLAFLIFAQSIFAAPVGRVLYRQSFSQLSTVSNAGIVKGTDGADGFELLLDGEALVVNTLTDRRAYTVFPTELPSDDCTVEFSFSFERLDTSNAYIAIMLTCRGAEPDNITAVPIRANGTCEGFGTLDEDLVQNIASGERVDVKIPIKNGDYYELNVTCGGVEDTLNRMSVGDVPKGQLGFAVRNASVKIYELAVMNGIGYSARSGKYSTGDTWSDNRPYRYTVTDVDKAVAPQTSDEIFILAAAAFVSASIAVPTLRRFKRIG